MSTMKKLAVVSTAFGLLAATSSGALAQKKYDPGASDTEIKIGNIMPYSGPASAYGVIGKTEEAYFKKVNAEGGINGRKINFISYDDAYSPPKTVEQARKLVESDEVLLVFNPLGTPSEHGDPEVPEHQEGAATVRRDRRHQVERSEELPLDDGLAAQLPERNADLREVHSEEQAERQDRRALSERRLRQGLSEGLQGRARRQGGIDDRHGGELRSLRTDHRLPHRQAEVDRRRRVHEHHHAEVRGAGDQEERRDRLEAAALPQQRLGLDRQRHEAGRLRSQPGHHLVRLPQGHVRSAVEGRRRHEGLRRVPDEVLPGRQPDRWIGDVRLHRRAGTRSRAEGLRRQSHARERHEAGRQHQGPRTRRPAAGHQGQHQRRPTLLRSRRSNCRSSRAKPGNCSARS